MKILIVTEYYRDRCFNGSEVFCSQLVNALRREHEIDVLARDSDEPAGARNRPTYVVPEGILADAWQLPDFLAAQVPVARYDLVYNLGALIFGCNIVHTLLKSNPDMPLVNHFQALLSPYAREEGLGPPIQLINGAGQKETARKALLNIFVSQSELAMSQEAGFGLRDPVSAVIPNGLDFEELDRIAEARAPESEKGTLTILTAGRFSDYTKGADLIYRAFAALRRTHPNIFLLSIANSDRFSYLLRELPETSFRISDWLPRQEFLGALAAADLVVLPSRYEPFGLIAVEALAMGVPVLANCVGGLSEIVHHGVSGALSPAADGSLGLLLNLRSLIRDRGRLRRMGAAGAAFVRQEYNMDRISCLVDKAIRRSLIGHESPAAVVAGA